MKLLLRFAGYLVDTLEKEMAGGLQEFDFFFVFKPQFVLFEPVAQIGDVGTVPEGIAETETPPDEVLDALAALFFFFLLAACFQSWGIGKRNSWLEK